MTVFGTAKISDDLFLVIDQVFRIFTKFSVSLLCYMSYTCMTSIRPVPLKKNHYFPKEILYITLFLLCSCFRLHPTTLLLKILGGRMHGPSTLLKFGGSVPHSLLGLRPCIAILKL